MVETKKFILPLAVKCCWDLDLLYSLGYVDENDPFRYEIVEYKLVVVPFEVVKMLCEDDSVNSYQVRIKDKRKNKEYIWFLKEPVTVITSNIVLDNYDPVEVAKFSTLREYEDNLSLIKREKHEIQQYSLKQRPVDLDFIKKVQTKLNPIVKQNVDLAESFQLFNGIEGYLPLLKEVISNFHHSSNGKKSVSGKAFEIRCATYLAKKQKEVIIMFNKSLALSTGELIQFDLESALSLIECKYYEKDINQSRLMQQMQCAQQYNKSFKLMVGGILSIKMKKWLEKNAIIFQDDLINT